MADPQTATLTQLRNIQVKTGQTIAQLHAVLAESGLAKTGCGGLARFHLTVSTFSSAAP